MRPIERVLTKLPDAEPDGDGWAARCPAHADAGRSLHVRPTAAGRAILRCDRGCSRVALARALRVSLTDIASEAESGCATGRVEPVAAPLNMLPHEPFPVGVLPEPVRGFITSSAQAIGCDSAYIALPLLAALAGAIGNTRRIQLKRGWCEPGIVWVVIVGESGALKTPALRLALQPLREIQGRMLRDHEAALAEHDRDALHYERELAGWKRDGRGSEPPRKPEPPAAKRLLVSDTTVEALGVILRDNPRGVLLARDEIGGWLGGFDRYAARGGADAAFWLSAHHGEPALVDRKGSGGRALYVPSACVSIAGGIQPRALARAIGTEHRENGMLARLLLAAPPRQVKRWTEADIAPERVLELKQLFEKLLALDFELVDGEPRPVVLPLTPEAKLAWIEFYNAHARETAERTGDLAAAFSKLEACAARLALIAHCVRQAAGDSTLASVHRVDERSIAAGVALARWFAYEAERVYAALDATPDQRSELELVDFIRRRGGSVTARELSRGPRQFRGRPDEAQRALDDLAARGWGHWEHAAPGPDGGRPASRFVLASPRGGDETPRHEVKNKGFVTVASGTGGAQGGGA